jgi:redox-sensitive bicupin YhaK (pirin superfamily)
VTMDARTIGAAGVALKIAASQEMVGAGVPVMRGLPTVRLEAVGPFVFLDHFGPAAPPPGGVPPHPHAGIEVISYLLAGENGHYDSFGNATTVGAGGTQWITSGRGMMHAEMLRGGADGLMHSVQLWVRQPEALDEAPPSYGQANADEAPAIDFAGGRLRLLSGELPGLLAGEGPVKLHSPTVLAHLTLAPGGKFAMPLHADFETALYVLAGAASVDGADVARDELALLQPTAAAAVANRGDVPLEALVLGGAPAKRPLIFRGPFVFGSAERTEKAYADFREGRMGKVEGAPF